MCLNCFSSLPISLVVTSTYCCLSYILGQSLMVLLMNLISVPAYFGDVHCAFVVIFSFIYLFYLFQPLFLFFVLFVLLLCSRVLLGLIGLSDVVGLIDIVILFILVIIILTFICLWILFTADYICLSITNEVLLD